MKRPIPYAAYRIYLNLKYEALELFMQTRDINTFNATMKRLEEFATKTKAFKGITNEVL